MKKVIGMFIFICAVAVIALASVYYARVQNTGSIHFALGGVVKLQNTKEFDVSNITGLNMEYSSENIIFTQGQSDKIVIEEYFSTSRKNNPTNMEVIEGTLYVKGNLIVTLNLFSFESEKVIVYLPKTFEGNIEAETGSGNIKTETGLIMKEFKAATGSGNIKCESIEASLIYAKAGSGNITLEKAQGKREAATGSGTIRIKDGEGDTKASAFSGSIKINNASGGMTASTGSGNITVDFVEVKDTVAAKAGSGSVKLEIPKDSKFSFEGSVSSGSIRTDFDDILSYNKNGKKAKGIYGENSEILIKTETKSGNTKITFK